MKNIDLYNFAFLCRTVFRTYLELWVNERLLVHISRCRMISRISLRARDFLLVAAPGVRTETLRLHRHFVNGVLLITFVLACTISVDGKKLYEFLAVTKVDGLPPAPSA